MSRIFESQPHIQEITEQYRLRSPKGISSINDMISNLAMQVEYAEMIERMSYDSPRGSYIRMDAESYTKRLGRMREQLTYASGLLNKYKSGTIEPGFAA